jgi:hypothetical protein
MGQTHLPSDERMELLRRASKFICQCTNPRPVRLGAWNCSECHQCGRLVIIHDEIVELFSRMTARQRHPSGRPRHLR